MTCYSTPVTCYSTSVTCYSTSVPCYSTSVTCYIGNLLLYIGNLLLICFILNDRFLFQRVNLNGSWKRPNKRGRRLLARRKLRLRLTSKGGTTMIGEIIPVLTCQSKLRKKVFIDLNALKSIFKVVQSNLY